MTEPGVRRPLPWGLVLTVVALAAVLASVYRVGATPNAPGRWEFVGAAVGAAACAFLVVRWVQSYLWAVLAGLLLGLHPLFRDAVAGSDYGLVAEALQWLVLAATVSAWRLTFLPRFRWRTWLVLAGVCCVATGLAWPLRPRAGLVAGLTCGGGLLAAALLAARLHRRRLTLRPSWLNITTAALVGLAAPVGGLFLAPVSVRHLDWHQMKADSDAVDLWHAALGSPTGGYRVHGFSADERDRWGWHQGGLALALMVWGFWRTFRRGWKEWARRKPPLTWALTLFGMIALVGASFHPGAAPDTAYLSLASLAVLLGVFGVADVVRGFMERLVLAPPEERE
jgi:hypothetical protein